MLIPYLSQNIEGSLDDKFREKMETIEAEKNRSKDCLSLLELTME